MNNVIASGYIQKKVYYNKNEATGEYEYKFYLNVYSSKADMVSAIPFKCTGWLADKVYAELQAGDYCEVVGEIVRENPQLIYVLVKELTYKKPKSRSQVHIKTTEFLQTFKTTDVIERIVKKEMNKNAKKEKN